MSILKVARMGHPILRKTALAVDPSEIATPAFQLFIEDLIETMREYDGVGLAAPQVHKSVRVCVIEVEANPRYKSQKNVGIHIFINPKIEVLTRETETCWEGCLSVPGLRGFVARPNKVRVQYLDRTGAEKVIEAQGFLATVLQHEFDHLDGRLYVDRLVDSTKLMFEQEFEKYQLPEEDEEV